MIDMGDRKKFGEEMRARRGRPRRKIPIVPTSVKLPEDVYDRLCRRATLEDKSLHGLMIDALTTLARSVR